MPDLGRIAIVLVETSSPGNLGSVARVMKNMGMGRLVLVDCKADLSEEARQRARGADDLLENAVRTSGLASALESFHLSVATSSRTVRWFDRSLQPREMAAELQALAPGHEVAILFGPERTGLTNEHLQYCHWQVRIPTVPGFSSLNLAHAVAIVAYELSQGLSAPPSKGVRGLAELGQTETFSQDLEGCLKEIQFLKKQNPREIMMTLRQLLARASPDDRDIRILRGILRQWKWYARSRGMQEGTRRGAEYTGS
ncbi:MAG: RNA methyltransferase [Acidobacteriota bacterium]|nr:RNA methyltransferase [Acidobacteriota bacterium]